VPDEIDLNDEEEAALSRAWARLAKPPRAPAAPFSADAPDLSGLGDLLNLSRQEVLDAIFDAAIDSFDLALPDAAFGAPDQPRVPAGQAGGGEWTSGGGGAGGDRAARKAYARRTAELEAAVERAERVHDRVTEASSRRLFAWVPEADPPEDPALRKVQDDLARAGDVASAGAMLAPDGQQAAFRKALKAASAAAAMLKLWGAEPGSPAAHEAKETLADAVSLQKLVQSAARKTAASWQAVLDATAALEAHQGDAPFYSPDQPRDELGRWTSGGGVAGAGSAEDRPKAAEAMREQIAVYAGLGISPVEANQGDCSTAAREAIKAIRAVGGQAAYGVPENNLGHVWVVAGGRHYDVQAPDGVDDPKDLPFFREESDLIEGGWRSTTDDRFGRVPALSATNRAGGIGRTPAEHAARRQAASDAVRVFASGQGPPTAAEAEALAGHLARLTVSQIHALKAEHGLRGSAPNKAALVVKMAERFRTWREGRAPKEAVPDWPADYDIFGKRDVFADEPHDPGTLEPTPAPPPAPAAPAAAPPPEVPAPVPAASRAAPLAGLLRDIANPLVTPEDVRAAVEPLKAMPLEELKRAWAEVRGGSKFPASRAEAARALADYVTHNFAAYRRALEGGVEGYLYAVRQEAARAAQGTAGADVEKVIRSTIDEARRTPPVEGDLRRALSIPRGSRDVLRQVAEKLRGLAAEAFAAKRGDA
jgi:hypothetical protein